MRSSGDDQDGREGPGVGWRSRIVDPADVAYSKPDSPLGREIAELAQAIDASFAPQVTAVAGTPARREGAARAR